MRYVLLAMLLLAGCETPTDKFIAAWPKLKGQPIGVLYDRWGRPDRVVEPEVAKLSDQYDGWIYVWNTSRSYAYTTPVTTSGFVGSTPFTATTNVPESGTWLCSVRVKANADRRIVDLGMSGSRGACSRFADRL